MSREARSPNYPAHGLRAAIGFAKLIYEHEKKAAAPMESLARAVGSENLTGPSRSKIASMNHYGLIERASVGHYKLSRIGLDLVLHQEGDEEYRIALKAAGLTPPLFRTLLEQHEASDRTLVLNLIRNHDFSDDGANRAVKAFRDTVEYAQIEQSEESSATNDDFQSRDELAKPGSLRSDVSHGMRSRTTDAMVAMQRTMVPEQQASVRQPSSSYVWLLADNVTAQVSFHGEVTIDALDAMQDYLGLMRRAVQRSQKVTVETRGIDFEEGFDSP